MTAINTSEKAKVAVLGGGAWGTALAKHCCELGHTVTVWAMEPEVVAGINGPPYENTQFLPGIKLPESMKASTDMVEVVTGTELILLVIPTQFIARTVGRISSVLQPHQIIVSCAKGISIDTLQTVNELLEGALPPALHPRLAYLSGPSFAKEVAQGCPTAVTIASVDDAVAERAQVLLSSPIFRCYRTNDVIGVELGGALKNVLAIACGISDGLHYGCNARAALITRGLSEISKMAAAKGANPLTMSGLAGMGDLVLTCTGDLSRNRTMGLRLAAGESLADITASMGGAVAEGVPTSRAAHQLALKLGLDCPVISGIYRVINEGADPRKVVVETMSRDLKQEVDALLVQAASAAQARISDHH